MCKKPKHSRNIDKCLKPIIDQINRIEGFKTLLSCCGHGRYPKTIVVLDQDTNEVFEFFSGMKLERKYKNGKIRKRYYIKDKDYYYYLPCLNSFKRKVI